MIIKYSTTKIEGVVEQTKENEEKLSELTKKAMEDDEDKIVKEAAKEGKPFWISK